MEQHYLPSDTPQQRLQDLMKEHKITQAELASKIGVTESSVSRFLKGPKDKLTTEQIISIARIFNVSSDFLLCLTSTRQKELRHFRAWSFRRSSTESLYRKSESRGSEPPAGKPPLCPADQHDCLVF